MQVYVPTPLRSYTHGQGRVEAQGATLGELMTDLDRRYPGIRFRLINEQDSVREHIRVFVNRAQAGGLDTRLEPGDQVQIILAISGG